MPVYCYSTNKRSGVVELIFPRGEAPEKVLIDNDDYYRNRSAEVSGMFLSVRGSSNRVKRPWPLECIASGVNANQANELRDHLRGRGCPTEVSEDGNPIYTSAAHRKRALKIRGMHDRNSYV